MLFPDTETVPIAPGAVLFRGAVVCEADRLLYEIYKVIAQSPLRRVVTPMGKPMSVEMTNCGEVGWVCDRSGYRYERIDPLTGCTWPTMPELLLNVACASANRAGYTGFRPDVCLINRYSPGSKMGMHQDRDERDFSQPIVSISLGLSVTFKFGGSFRSDPTMKLKLQHGDVVVFGGQSRLAFHGVGTLRLGHHALTGNSRINLTLRQSL
jgi:DNA oxidative demethylase